MCVLDCCHHCKQNSVLDRDRKHAVGVGKTIDGKVVMGVDMGVGIGVGVGVGVSVGARVGSGVG